MEDNKLQQNPISRLYNNIKNDYDLPDFNTFKADMSDSKKVSRLHSTLVKDGYEMPSFDVFSVDMGLKKKDGGIVSSPTGLPLQGFNQKQIDLLKKGVEKPIQSVSQKKSSGLVVPTNLPKQEALAYENELKLNDVAVNTLTDIYKKKGLKFDPSRPAAKKQIQEYVDKSINGDLTKVTGKDGKEYLVRSQGFLESAGDSFVRSLKDPIESTEINFTDSPEELANLLDEKIRREPNVPKAAPSAVSGYLGGLAGGLPKLAAIAAIPYVGQTAMVGEMYYNALANQRRELYQRGLEEGMDRVSAAKKAMEIAPVSAIPDALVAAVMAKGVGGKAASGVIPNAAKESFIKAAGSALKSIGLVSATGGFAGYERSKIQQRAGYKVTDAEAIENGFREAGDYAIMDAAFKVAHIGPKYLSSAAKNVLSTVPKEVLNVVAEKYPDGQRTLDEIPKFVETKAKVQDFVPEEKIASVAGLTEKTDNIKSEIKDLEEKKKAVTPAIAKEIDLEISEKNKEVDFYDNQIKKVIKSKDQTGISEEVDDATGLKAGEQIVPKEFKITEEVTPTEVKVTEEVKPTEVKVTEEVKPAEVKVTEEVKPAEIKQPAKELSEGESVTFKTPEGSKVTGEKVEIPGYEADEDFVDNKIKIIKEQGKPLSEFKKGDKVIWASDWDKKWKQLSEGTIVKAGNEYEIKRFSDNPMSERFKTFRLTSDTDVILKPEGEANYKGEENIAKKKEYAQKDLDRAEAKRIHSRVAEMEPPSDAEQVALRYLAEGGKVSQDAINEVSGTTKRASLNTGRRELKTEEAKARDYAGGKESLDDLAHRLWEASGQEISERDIKNALMSEIGNNNTRLDASKAYLERYNIEYQQEKYYERFIEEREEQHAKVQEELEKDLRKPLEEEIEGMSSEEHINNLIKQYEAETKRENKQLGPEGEGEAVKEISSRDTGKKAPEKAELAKEYKEAVSKASKKAKENAKKEFVDRNFENLVEKLKIQIKCPT